MKNKMVKLGHNWKKMTDEQKDNYKTLAAKKTKDRDSVCTINTQYHSDVFQIPVTIPMAMRHS